MKDYKILLVCSGGMSTTILMTKMQKYAEEKGFGLKVDACAMGVCQDKAPEYGRHPARPADRLSEGRHRRQGVHPGCRHAAPGLRDGSLREHLQAGR